MNQLKKIKVINTGGTFSSALTDSGLVPDGKDGTDKKLSYLIKEFTNICTLQTEDYCSLDSANIMPEDWANIAKRINEIVNDYDGIVIIHGTDTMAYTASMLSFMLQNIPIPVVITGSQMPLGVPMSDAEENFRCAVWTALSDLSGVYVAFDRKIMLGCRTSKVRTISFDAFESINYDYIGEVNAYGLQLKTPNNLQKREYKPDMRFSDRVATLKLFPGMNPEIFSLLREDGYEAIYIEGFGLGGVPFLKNDITAEIKKASDDGLTILVGSQCRYEGSDLNVYETGYRILECGGIPVHDMTQESVITKLMWCLGQTKNREDIQKMFNQNMVGEIRKED